MATTHSSPLSAQFFYPGLAQRTPESPGELAWFLSHFSFTHLGWGPVISNEFPGDTAATGPGTLLGEPRLCAFQYGSPWSHAVIEALEA